MIRIFPDVRMLTLWVALVMLPPKAMAALPTGVVSSWSTPTGHGLTRIVVWSEEDIIVGSTHGGLWKWNPVKNTAEEWRPSTKKREPIFNLLSHPRLGLLSHVRGGLELRARNQTITSVKLPPLEHLAFSPTGRQIAGMSEEPPIWFFDPATGKTTHRVDRQVWVDEMRYSPTGEFLATTRFGRVYLWKTASGDLAWKSRLEGNLKGFVFSPDGTKIFTSLAKEGLWILDVPTGRILGRYSHSFADVEENSLHRMAVSPDGTLLAETPVKNRIEIWETATGRPILLLEPHAAEITDLSFLPDGVRLVSTDASGQAWLWDLTRPEFALPVDVSRGYSRDELEQFWRMLGEPQGHSAWSALVALKHRPEQALELLDDPPDERQLIHDLIDQLNHERFDTRHAAMRALKQLSLKAEPFLQAAMKATRSAEVKARIRRLLSYLAGPQREAQLQLLEESRHHRQLRIVLLLKWIGTAEAQTRLQSMRDTAENTTVREEAARALQWIEKKD